MHCLISRKAACCSRNTSEKIMIPALIAMTSWVFVAYTTLSLIGPVLFVRKHSVLLQQ